MAFRPLGLTLKALLAAEGGGGGGDPGQIADAADIECCVALYPKIIGYSGNLFRMHRSSDGDVSDFTSVSAAVAHLAGATGTIMTWYDQSGNGNHFTAPSSAYGPTLEESNATTSLPILQFGTTKNMAGTAAFNFGSDYAVIYHLVPTHLGGAARCICGDSANWLMGPYSGSLNLYAGAGFAGGSVVANGDSRIHAGYKTSGGGTFHRVDGSGVGGSGGTGYPGQLNIGADNPFAEPARSSISEIVMLTTAGTTRIAEIEASMSARY